MLSNIAVGGVTGNSIKSYEQFKFENLMLKTAKNKRVSQFFFPRNVLSPEGRCEAYPVGV